MSSRIARNTELIHAGSGEDLVMFDMDAGNYYGLDPIGRRIWELIAEPCGVADICVQLQTEFDVAPETCGADVLTFLGQLAEQRIVHIVHE